MLIPTPYVPDIRAEIARLRYPIYQLAAKVNVHPGRMSRYLNERTEMPQSVADRVFEALREESATREVTRVD